MHRIASEKSAKAAGFFYGRCIKVIELEKGFEKGFMLPFHTLVPHMQKMPHMAERATWRATIKMKIRHGFSCLSDKYDSCRGKESILF